MIANMNLKLAKCQLLFKWYKDINYFKYTVSVWLVFFLLLSPYKWEDGSIMKLICSIVILANDEDGVWTQEIWL